MNDRDQRQKTVAQWCVEAFGKERTSSLPQRGLRLLEEAIEASQVCGVPIDQAHNLVSFVYSRPVGEIEQELGGVGVTLLALADAVGKSADLAEHREVERVLAKPLEHFRARNAEKDAAGFKAKEIVDGPNPFDSRSRPFMVKDVIAQARAALTGANMRAAPTPRPWERAGDRVYRSGQVGTIASRILDCTGPEILRDEANAELVVVAVNMLADLVNTIEERQKQLDEAKSVIETLTNLSSARIEEAVFLRVFIKRTAASEKAIDAWRALRAFDEEQPALDSPSRKVVEALERFVKVWRDQEGASADVIDELVDAWTKPS